MNSTNFDTDMRTLGFRAAWIADLNSAVSDHVVATGETPDAARQFVYDCARKHWMDTGRPREVADLRRALKLREQVILHQQKNGGK